MTGKSFKIRILSALSWTMGGHIVGQFLRLGSNLIMTRLLVPDMFGVMVIANVIMVGLHLITDMGINHHIIQSKKSESENFLNTAWVVQIIRGLIIWLFSLFLSIGFVIFSDSGIWPPDSVYADEQLPYIIIALSFNAVIAGFQSTKQAMASRNLVIHKVVQIELASQMAGLLLMIFWAYINPTIWSLVFGSMLTVILKTISSHIFLTGHKNKYHFDKKIFFELFHFGKWIFLSSTLGFLVSNGDKFVLGGLIDTRLLGVYSIAVFFVAAVQQLIGKICQGVALPALSEVARGDRANLKKIYYKFRTMIDAITLVIAGALFISGHHIIEILYDDRYIEAGKMLEILALLLIAERYSLTGQCFIALGKPKYLIPMILLRIPVLFIGVPIIYAYFGLEAAIWLIALNRIIEWPVLFYLKIKMSIFTAKNELYLLLFILLGMILGWILNNIFFILS